MPNTYTVERLTEETNCAECGWPIYIGERVWEHTDDDSQGFCSRTCEVRAREARMPAHAKDETP